MNKNILVGVTAIFFSALIYTGCKKSDDDSAATATCADGIQNQNESGVDCGGPCTACATCSDGIQNQNETGVDCGGPCPACNSVSIYSALIDGVSFSADTFYVDLITGSGVTGYRIYAKNNATNSTITAYIEAANINHTIIAGIQYNLSPLTAGLNVLTFTYKNAAGNLYVALGGGKLKFTEINSTTGKASGEFNFDGIFSGTTKHITSGIFTNAPIQ